MTSVLVLREFDEFSRILSEKGFDIINLPVIETKPLENLSEFEERLAKIEIYDGIFLTSRNSARVLAEQLRVKQVSFGGKVYVLGKRGFEILRTENLNLIFFETANTARELLGKIAPEELKNKRFLFVRGEKSLRTIPEFLEKIASVDETIVYRNRKKTVGIDKIKEISEKLDSGEIRAASFFSPSAAQSFLEQFGKEILHQTMIAAIGTTTADFLEKENLRVGFIASKATAEDFASELAEYLQNGKRKAEND
jgi:uroporphyrinogen-III synthase